MSGKISSEILRIDLDDATFNGTKEFIEPTYVNFFFGNNGTGKSTITKALQYGKGITYRDGRSRDDYKWLIFDQDFINANVQSYHHLDGVFTIDEANVEILRQIEEKEKELDDATKTFSGTNLELKKKYADKKFYSERFQNDCWEKTRKLREKFIYETNEKRKWGNSKLTYANEIIRHKCVKHDLEVIWWLCKTAYSSTAKKSYSRLHEVKDSCVLDNIPDSEILSIRIVNSAETEFATFLKNLGATDWFRQGHDEYQKDERCPYCARKLPHDFERIVTESFDYQYENNLKRLNEFLDNYTHTANELLRDLSLIHDDCYPSIYPSLYETTRSSIETKIRDNIASIEEKKADPSKVIELSKTQELLEELAITISDYNKIVDENNADIALESKQKQKCNEQFFEHMSFLLKDVIEAYVRIDGKISEEITELEKIAERQKMVLAHLKTEIGILREQTVETETTIHNINTMLKDVGFQGFEMRPGKVRFWGNNNELEEIQPLNPITYEVVRTETGEIAKDLSEGEKNFIAFLYFQQKVFGSDASVEDAKQKIVVIDDPVSSLDSNALFIIGEQVRKMIEICRNNADNRHPVQQGNFIKQIFILTHNTYFHHEVTYSYEKYYKFVSFYLIRKQGNRSFVKPMQKPDPENNGKWLNVNPVKNSYAALWQEYKELDTVVPLMNVIRRILEYYFLQICGYDGSQLRKVVLKDGEQSEYERAMLAYISSSTYGVGFYHIEEVFDVEQCRDAFRRIFVRMNQVQHYNMMMGSN